MNAVDICIEKVTVDRGMAQSFCGCDPRKDRRGNMEAIAQSVSQLLAINSQSEAVIQASEFEHQTPFL